MAAAFDTVPIGARVVVRARLDPRRHAPYDGPSMTDAVGTLVSRTHTDVVVATRRGEVTIARERIVAAKEIPPRPVRRGAPHRAIGIEDLQRTMIDAWPPMERELLGQWHLHASLGFTGRGNSTVVLGDPGVALDAAIAHVEQWYAVRDLPPVLSLCGPVGFDPGCHLVGAAALAAGYTVGAPTLTLTADLDEVIARTETAASPALGVEVSSDLTAQWLAGMARYRDVHDVATAAILTGSPQQAFALVRERGEPVALGRLGVGSGWAGLAAMWVAPSHRRRGLARAVIGALARTPITSGIRSIHLQTRADNTAAVALYERVGFSAHHGYVYLTGRSRPRPCAD